MTPVAGSATPPVTDHIEILGVRGAGKSTLYRHIEQRTRASPEVRMVSSRDAIAQAALEASRSAIIRFAMRWLIRFERPERAVELADERCVSEDIADFAMTYRSCFQHVIRTFGELPPERVEVVPRWMLQLFADYMASARGAHGRRVMFDEGFAVRALSLFGFDSRINWAGVRGYLQSVPLPSILYVMTVPSDVAELRSAAARRRKGQFPEGPAVWAGRFQLWTKVIEGTVEMLTDRGTSAIRLDGTLPTEELCEIVLSGDPGINRVRA